MAITVHTDNPRDLLVAIKRAINENRVRTWSYDTDGDFTHTAEQWRSKAWLRPREEDHALVLSILTPRGTKLSTELYAIYHGRFIEMLLAHFDGMFRRAAASAMPESNDVVAG